MTKTKKANLSARILYSTEEGYYSAPLHRGDIPCAVIECLTQNEARAVVARANKYGVKSLMKTRTVTVYVECDPLYRP